MGRVYISGPISGRNREDYMRQFCEAEEYLRNEGLQTVNPTRLLPCRWPWVYRLMGYRLTLLYDLFFLMRCQGIYMLDGWQQSRGARIEHYVAGTLGMVVIDE